LQVSLLTCAPGEELYSTFGHTALRVQDPSKGIDLVYNYGTFEFGPDFYSKFIRGKLLYYLSVEPFPDFMMEYQMESRSVEEQVLNLSCAEKTKLLNALQLNAEERNRYYKYDFLFDNCTTRARDIVAANTFAPVSYRNILGNPKPSFRDLIHSYLDKGGEPWSKLGIDILLGEKLDRKVTNKEAMFLPDYLLKGFDSASVAATSLVARKQMTLTMPLLVGGKPLFTPFIVFTLLLLAVVLLSISRSSWAATTINFFDFIFFSLLGLAGILILFMWFGTDHKVCRDNFNLLWALPTDLIGAFLLLRTTRWSRGYFAVVSWITLALLVGWFFLPQQLNLSLVPLSLIIIFRSWKLSKKGNARKSTYI
jgi:hypothetical protein